MRFFVRKRHQTPTVIIVALIDVLIVIVIFLTVTTTFKQQPALRLALPESTQAQKSGATEAALLVVSITATGGLYLGTDQLPVTLDRLRAEFRVRAAQDPALRLALSADENAPFGQIVKVMDAAKDAGIKTISAFTREPGRP